ncbi:hypothetical protein DPMN_014030 [Dreissena polymorpha]|uniref:Uncharacterized protein n=1 Tax=Dreissena polymorpha TaxID=45954 RepID=A0A9D4S4A6_DREPO|nr:hypothetical protein DPMN_014030 [Dreissena polymorpha]
MPACEESVPRALWARKSSLPIQLERQWPKEEVGTERNPAESCQQCSIGLSPRSAGSRAISGLGNYKGE